MFSIRKQKEEGTVLFLEFIKFDIVLPNLADFFFKSGSLVLSHLHLFVFQNPLKP